MWNGFTSRTILCSDVDPNFNHTPPPPPSRVTEEVECTSTPPSRSKHIFRFHTGVIPVMSAPSVDGSSDGMLAEAVLIAGKKGLVGPLDHVVCLMTIKDSLVVKIVSMDRGGAVKVKKGELTPPLPPPSHTSLPSAPRASVGPINFWVDGRDRGC